MASRRAVTGLLTGALAIAILFDGVVVTNSFDDAYVIDPELCTDCGTCVDECPVGAISQE